jgi:prepilin-type N-terminal cleavage/methylation domain-containing protein/prepilin-type processing-associated H-X9-DG protein
MRRAFTLIELLVVIAIIAILAAILFPVFAQAKVAAKKTASVSNAKQNVLAQFMYENDNDDVYISSWARGFPGDSGFWTQPYMKNLGVLMEPNKTVSAASLATVCANDSYYGSYDFTPNGRDNPTNEPYVWGWGINKGVSWMDGTGIQNSSFTPANKGQVIMASLNGKTIPVTVWSVQVGRSASAVVSPADTFYMADSGELPRMSMQLEAMTPAGLASSDANNSPCFIASHAGMPYAGGNTYAFCDGHVKWETFVKTPTNPSGPGGGLPQVSSNPCRYLADHDPSENFGGCKNGWR